MKIGGERVKGFSDRVKNWWTTFNTEGRSDYTPGGKLKALIGKNGVQAQWTPGESKVVF